MERGLPTRSPVRLIISIENWEKFRTLRAGCGHAPLRRPTQARTSTGELCAPILTDLEPTCRPTCRLVNVIMGVLLNLQFLVKRLEYDRYFIEKSVHRLLKIQSSHHTRSDLHISIPLLSLIKTKQTAIIVLELE